LLKKDDFRFGDIIYKESERLQVVIEDLFELARMEEPHFQIDPEPTELNQLLKQISERIRLKFEEK